MKTSNLHLSFKVFFFGTRLQKITSEIGMHFMKYTWKRSLKEAMLLNSVISLLCSLTEVFVDNIFFLLHARVLAYASLKLSPAFVGQESY